MTRRRKQRISPALEAAKAAARRREQDRLENERRFEARQAQAAEKPPQQATEVTARGEEQGMDEQRNKFDGPTSDSAWEDDLYELSSDEQRELHAAEYAPEECEECANSFGPCHASQVRRREENKETWHHASVGELRTPRGPFFVASCPCGWAKRFNGWRSDADQAAETHNIETGR